MLFPLLFVIPLLISRWQKRRIPAGADVEVIFDLALPSKWAAELTQRALTADGTSSRIFREKRQWLCSVTRPMEYQAQAITKATRQLDRVAAARGGNCMRYKVKLGKRLEVYRCEMPDQDLAL